MAMTYDSLVNQIMSYLNRTDENTLDQVPNFILQAENRISREAKTIGQEVYVQGNLTAGLSVYQKPARWRRTICINYGSGVGNNTFNSILLRSYEFCRKYWRDATQQGAPRFYSDYGYNNYLIAPTPDAAYPFEIAYLQLIDPLTPENQVNWLTEFAPDLLLYACLLETAPFLKDDERIPVWKDYYDRALQSLNAQDEQRILDRSSNRISD